MSDHTKAALSLRLSYGEVQQEQRRNLNLIMQDEYSSY